MKAHLLSTTDLDREAALQILDTAEELARVSDMPIKKMPTLRGRTVVNLFFEDSTRTRISFEAAAKRLSADACLKHPWLNTAERRPSTDRPPTSPTFFVEALERIRGINADRSNSHIICVFFYW